MNKEYICPNLIYVLKREKELFDRCINYLEERNYKRDNQVIIFENSTLKIPVWLIDQIKYIVIYHNEGKSLVIRRWN